ncbi:flagellar biosynthesis protein [Virgibacillus natechei]|uniref:Flagellar biosynthesis protein n=1 Tax=Virgibacillus natechei TaxID=1216297 RepID=A0ABS4IB07_9BACI|nr:EscU/YscU/HrcU family type III secretion system export apparatus switch protein [Virgibacillus natechei]MBP1968117.1 flagellar biosynthesis protein [Virgibacillus natechei]UZD14604.1 EscU/YscU/HrcU family type III secretion system export apparatus switch protein [Virgibacillus natechei]
MTKGRKKAAALRYDQKHQSAPIIAASGKGLTADAIIHKAEENDIPILEDSSLIEILAELNINETIPEELYQAVAEVFAFIYRADQSMER